MIQLDISKEELNERFIEFNIISYTEDKEPMVDLIQLSQLYDFYENDFYEEDFYIFKEIIKNKS